MARFFTFAFIVSTLTTVGGCGDKSGGPSGTSVRLSGGGSSFIDPIMQKWSTEYGKAKGGEINYVASSSGKGIADVTAKNLDFGCSDAPMNAKEVEAAAAQGGEVVHVPLTVGAVAIAFNLDGIQDLKLSGEVLAEIYLKKVTKWNDPKIAALNPGLGLPGKEISPVRRNDSSGTTNIFTEYLSKRSAEFKANPGTSKDPKWPEGLISKKGNDGIADAVKTTAGAIGYVELAYAKKNGIAYATLVNKAGKPIKPDAASVTAAVEEAIKVKQEAPPYSLHPLAFSFTDATGDAAYPIVGATYAIVFKKQPKDKGTAIVAFFKWAVTDGQKLATDLDYAPLPADLAKKVEDLLGSVTFE